MAQQTDSLLLPPPPPPPCPGHCRTFEGWVPFKVTLAEPVGSLLPMPGQMPLLEQGMLKIPKTGCANLQQAEIAQWDVRLHISF